MSDTTPKPKVAILVDVQNIYYTTREVHGRNFDYNTFWAKVTAGREVVHAVAYATDRGDEKQRQFQNILRAIGFEVRLKPMRKRRDGTTKADWDVGIALDAMDYAQDVDVVVLASGDGDFELLVRRMRDRFGVSVEVCGVPQLTAVSMMRLANKYIPVEGALLL